MDISWKRHDAKNAAKLLMCKLSLGAQPAKSICGLTMDIEKWGSNLMLLQTVMGKVNSLSKNFSSSGNFETNRAS